MPRARAIKPQFTFIGGLFTEASELDYPDGVFEDGADIDLDSRGTVSRRLGMNGESSYVLSSTAIAKGTIATYAINRSLWTNVAGDENTNFVVIQIGPTIYFYDTSSDPISDNIKSFTINLNNFAAPAATNVAGSDIFTASGDEKLFVVGTQIEPFYISYDSNTDTITTTKIDIKVRDFEGVEDNLEVDEQPTTLTNEHNYNLKNQGWIDPGSGTDPISTFFSAKSKYPANNQVWWVGKDTNEDLDSTLLDKAFFGNTPAAKGHYILSRFNKDRSTASGIAGLTTVTENERPQSVAFFAGRVWYGFGDELLFSQQILSDSNIPKCHQDADPTSEEISDLLATDGGVIPIPEAGKIKFLQPIGSGLLVFANNGVWFVSGPEDTFKATDFSVIKISGVGVLSEKAIVDVEGIPVWWAADGIYTIQLDQVSLRPSVANISDQTIKTFYLAIPAVSRNKAQGIYDKNKKEVRWLYSSNTGMPTDTPYDYNRSLRLDVRLQAFIPGTINKLTGQDYPLVAGLYTLPDITTIEQANVVTVNGDTVTVGGDTVTVGTESILTAGSDISTKYIILHDEGGSNVKWTFGEFNNDSFTDFVDFDTNSVGQDYTSFVMTGPLTDDDISRKKQIPYISSFFEITETAFVLDGNGGYQFNKPSGCLLQARWGFANSSTSNQFSTQEQVYRFKKPVYVDPNDLTFDPGYEILVSRSRLRGKGEAYQLRWESQSGKDFRLKGWSLVLEGNQNV